MDIVVLCGGNSTEREVSINSGYNVCQALREKNHNAILMDVFFGMDNCDIFETSKNTYDVTKEKDVSKLYHRVIDEFGKVDVLINNAGKCKDNYVQFMSLEQWNEVLTTNLTSMYLCSRVFSKNMIANGGGKIINISSLKGQLGSEGQCNYAASKAGVIGLTKSLAKEMGMYGVSVNAICPGFIVTDLNRLNSNKAEIAKKMSILREQSSLQDFLTFVIMLSSDLLQGISGQVFNLDSRIN